MLFDYVLGKFSNDLAIDLGDLLAGLRASGRATPADAAGM